MLTPRFTCRQDSDFIIVTIMLTAHCKVAQAEFDITDCQLTFHCAPYYLRLTFSHPLTQGRGERATYDLTANEMTVYLPKLEPGVEFEGLDMITRLLSTEKQRMQLVRVVESNGHAAKSRRNDDQPVAKKTRGEGVPLGGSSEADGEEEEEEEDEDYLSEEETEFVQENPMEDLTNVARQAADEVYYGFNNEASRFFTSMEHWFGVVDIEDPDAVPMGQRRQLRIDRENADFCPDHFYEDLADPEEQIRTLMQVKPSYVLLYEEALANWQTRRSSEAIGSGHGEEGAPSSTAAPRFATPGEIGVQYSLNKLFTEDDVAAHEGTAGGRATVVAWSGNVMSLDKGEAKAMPEATLPPSLASAEQSTAELQAASQPHPRTEGAEDEEEHPAVEAVVFPELKRNPHIFVPNPKPPLTFTAEETEMMMNMPRKSHLLVNEACILYSLVDILLAYCYERLVFGEEEGSPEAAWTITKLSTTMSWLDTFSSMEEVVRSFVRRVLCYPLFRHHGLANRCIRDCGVLLLNGRNFVLRAILNVKWVLDHSEVKHRLSHLYVNSYASYVQYLSDATLENVATDLHRAAVLTDAAKLSDCGLPIPALFDEEEES